MAQQNAAAANESANLANMYAPTSFPSAPAVASTTDGVSFAVVGAYASTAPTQTAPQAFSLGTSTCLPHSELSKDTFGLFCAFGGGGRSAFTAVSRTTWTANETDSITLLVGSGASSRCQDSSLESRTLARVTNYTALTRHFKIITGGNHEVEETVTVIVHDTVTDRDTMHHVALMRRCPCTWTQHILRKSGDQAEYCRYL